MTVKNPSCRTIRHDREGQGRGYQQVSGLLHRQDRGKDHLDKKICREADEDHQRQDDIKPVVTVFAGIPGIIKNLFAA